MLFLCVDLNDEKAVIQDYWKEKAFTMTPARQHGSAVSDAFGVQGYPSNYLIGPDGRVLWRKLGWDGGELRALLLK